MVECKENVRAKREIQYSFKEQIEGKYKVASEYQMLNECDLSTLRNIFYEDYAKYLFRP